jgi:protein ImuB
MARRVASLWLPRFATDRIHRLEPGLEGAPVAVAATLGNSRLVLAANAAAEAGGVGAGLALADARALTPQLTVVEHDPTAERRLLLRLARWTERYTPWTQVDHVEEGAGAGLWLEVTGCAHLFGGEAALLEDLIRRLGRQGFAAKAAIADTPGAASALARYSGAQERIAPEGGARESLAELPVAALRLGSADADGLARLGFKRIGDLYSLPRAALARRFGARTLQRLDQALGRAEESIAPARPETPLRAHRLFAEPIAAAETIAAVLKRLLADLKPLLEREGLGVRRLELACHRVDDTLQGVEIGTSRPVRDPDHLFRLFALKLERIDPGFGIEALALIARRAEPMGARQLGRGGAATRPLRQPLARARASGGAGLRAGVCGGLDRGGAPTAAARAARADRGSCDPARCAALAVPLAPEAASRARRRGAGAHRARMVARSRLAHARLLPRRG